MVPIKKDEPVIFLGNIHEIYLPSGRVVKIRETNGDDDEILSNREKALTGDSVMTFMANITEFDSEKGDKPLTTDILNWPVSDRYYLLFKQRLINQGDILNFGFVCQSENCPSQINGETIQELEEDLKQFDGDFSKEEYSPINLHQPKRYPNGMQKVVEFTTSSGKYIRYKILTGVLEKKQLAVPVDNHTKNLRLTSRELQYYTGDSWIIQLNFKAFSSREMSEIRKDVEKNDPLFDPMVRYTCPQCKTPYALPLLSIPSFYWPGEQI